MKVLITGGAGFLGSAFIKFLLKQDAEVSIVNLDVLNYAGKISRLENVSREFPERYHFVRGDIQDVGAVEAALQKYQIQGVINFAAQTHVDRSIQNATEFVRTNVLGTQVLLEASRRARISRFLQISTDEVYGPCGPSDAGFSETDPLKPSSPYSASKASADLMCLSYYKTFGVPVLISRSCNIYGPWQHPEKLIPHFISLLLNEKKLPLYGDGKNRRCWLFVDDYVRALALVWEKGVVGEVHHIAGTDDFSNWEVTQKILAHFGKDASCISHVTDRPGHDFRYAIKADWLYKKHGFHIHYPFEKGLKETVLWYKDHHHEFQN